MPRRFSSRELINLIERDGWVEVNQTGSHKQFKHGHKPGRVTVPHPYRAVHPKTAASILRQAGIKEELS